MPARTAGAERVVCVVRPGRRRGRGASGRRRGRRADARARAPGPRCSPRATRVEVRVRPVVVLSGDHPAGHGRAARRRCSPSTTQEGASATRAHHRPARPRRLRAHRARRRRRRVERIVETKYTDGVPPEELAIREINLGTYVFDAQPSSTALDAVELAERRALPDRSVPDSSASARRDDRHAHDRRRRRGALGVNDRADLMAGRGGRPARGSSRATPSAGVTFLQPGTTRVEAGVTIGRDTRHRPGHGPGGQHDRRRALRARPAHDRRATRTIGDGARVLHSYLVEAEVGADASDRSLRLPAPGHRRRRGREGRHLRGGQELGHRRRREGAAPVLHRRRRRRRGQQPRAPARSPRTTTAAGSTARSSERA